MHTDLDPGSKKIKYILSGDGAGTIFQINDITGDIHAIKRLDREEKAEYTLTAQAVDWETSKPLEPPSEFIIKVQDINDNAPEFLNGPYHATVPEMSILGMYASNFTDLLRVIFQIALGIRDDVKKTTKHNVKDQHCDFSLCVSDPDFHNVLCPNTQ
ncbi:hypothetical protein STEG23_002468 [Scotinomys teguina]